MFMSRSAAPTCTCVRLGTCTLCALQRGRVELTCFEAQASLQALCKATCPPHAVLAHVCVCELDNTKGYPMHVDIMFPASVPVDDAKKHTSLSSDPLRIRSPSTFADSSRSLRMSTCTRDA